MRASTLASQDELQGTPLLIPTKVRRVVTKGLPVGFPSTVSTVRSPSKPALNPILMMITMTMITIILNPRNPRPAVGRAQEAARPPTTLTKPPGRTAEPGQWLTAPTPR